MILLCNVLPGLVSQLTIDSSLKVNFTVSLRIPDVLSWMSQVSKENLEVKGGYAS